MNAMWELIPVIFSLHFYSGIIILYLIPLFLNLHIYYVPVIPESTSKYFGEINSHCF